MKTKIVSRLLAGVIGVAFGFVVLTPSASAACGPKLPSGLLPMTDHVTANEAASFDDLTPKASPAPPTSAQIVGLWLVTITVGGQPFGLSFEAFTSDGFEILNDNSPPQAGNVCLGVWTATARNIIRVNHPSWNYDDQGNPIGTIVIKSQISLDNGGNSYHGTFTAEVYDTNNHPVGSSISGELSATRIKP